MRESLLTRDPEIQSVNMRSLMGVASAIKRESMRRYAALARTMERRGESATAAAFRVMLDEEQRHADDIARRAAALGEPRTEPGHFEWELAADVARSWDAIAGSALLTPYRAFAIAVDNEKRAFALYSYLAARATDPHVRSEAERLGVEELRHAEVMRRWRREAWHRERRAPAAKPGPIGSAEALDALLASREAGIAAAHHALAARLRALGDEDSARLLESSLPATASPSSNDAHAGVTPAAGDSRVHLLVAAQKPLEALSEELEELMRATEGALFERAEAALVDVVTRLARIVLQAARAMCSP
ncbi:MAG: ferritin family protein [Burkholderiales bacterium]|nr:ferritin family protein [Burkholderiales bacterium]